MQERSWSRLIGFGLLFLVGVGVFFVGGSAAYAGTSKAAMTHPPASRRGKREMSTVVFTKFSGIAQVY